MGRGRRPDQLRAGAGRGVGILDRLGLTGDAATAAGRQALARRLAAEAARDGEALARRVVGAYVIAEPRFRLGLVPRSLASVVRPRDWDQLVLERFDEVMAWGERDFARWLNALIAARSGVHRPGRRGQVPAAGDDATAAALLASISADG